MIEERTWKEFRENGLLWWVNRILHVFGWVIVVEMNDGEHIKRCYPAKSNFTCFSTDVEEEGVRKFKEFIKNNNRTL